MTITITHLYYDLLNLYGEQGNIKALKNYLENMGIKVKINHITIDDEINLKNTDFVYIGSGTEQNQMIVLKHLMKYKNEIKEYILNNKYFLATGNSIELFGSVISSDKNIKCLNIFDYTTYRTSRRVVGEVLCKTKLIPNYVLGFINSIGYTKENENSLFELVKKDDCMDFTSEGVHYNNFYGTYIIGPLLVRNPKLLTYIANNVIKDKDPNFKLGKVDLKLENKAYKTFLENSYKEYVKN